MALNFMNWLRLGRNAGAKLLASGLIAGLLMLVAHAAEQQGLISLRKDSPTSYTVKEGDTLWDIASRFLEKPWLWPQVWQVNPQIQNPDLIYPGDLISLSYQDGKPVLSLNRDAGTSQSSSGSSSSGSTSSGAIVADSAPELAGIRTERRSPQVRREPLLSPIPAIPLSQVFSFLNKSNVVDGDTFEKAPYLLGEQQGRNIFSTGESVFARGNWSSNLTTYDIVREGRRFMDPDSHKKLLGVESVIIGTATITSINGDRAVLKVDATQQEARVGDRLIAREKLAIDDSYLPIPPDFAVDAAIVSIADGRSRGGQYDTLVLNQGGNIGLKAGHVLAIQKPAVVVSDDIGKMSFMQRVRHALGKSAGRSVEYPGENIATVLIYRVYDHASLGLILSSKLDVSTDDRAVTP